MAYSKVVTISTDEVISGEKTFSNENGVHIGNGTNYQCTLKFINNNHSLQFIFN